LSNSTFSFFFLLVLHKVNPGDPEFQDIIRPGFIIIPGAKRWKFPADQFENVKKSRQEKSYELALGLASLLLSLLQYAPEYRPPG
jgi:hypothetical protein